MKRRNRHAAFPIGAPILSGRRGEAFLIYPAATASGTFRWPGDGEGSVAVTSGASALVSSLMSRIVRILVPRAGAGSGSIEIRDANNVARFVSRVNVGDVYPKVVEIASGFGMILVSASPTFSGNFAVLWTGDAAATSPQIIVTYKDQTGLRIH